MNEKQGAWGAGRAAFAVFADAILADLEAGWPMTVVHRKFRDRIGVGYRQFARYANARRRKNAAKAAPPAAGAPNAPAPAPAAPIREPKQAPRADRPDFHFDPMDAYRKKFV